MHPCFMRLNLQKRDTSELQGHLVDEIWMRIFKDMVLQVLPWDDIHAGR